MGILTSMNNAVGGLGAQSFALENISGNIANSSTTGFKRKDTSFQDLVRSNTSNPAHATSGGVSASSRSTITLDGDIQGSKVDTHLAINGTGFFSVSADPLDNTLGTRYTRAGDFEQYYDSRNGQTYLRNGSGYSLVGVNLTPATGEDPRGPITIDKTSQSAKASTQITYKLNLPTEPVTARSTANPTVNGANIYSPDWPAGAAAPISYQIANTGKVVGSQVADFMDNSISGGTTTVYDSQGTPAVVQLRWAKIDEAPPTVSVTTPATQPKVVGGSALPADGSLASLNGKSFNIYLAPSHPIMQTFTVGAAEFDATSTRSDLVNKIQAFLDTVPTPATNTVIKGGPVIPADGGLAALNGKSFTVAIDGAPAKTITIGASEFDGTSTRWDAYLAIRSKLDAPPPAGFGPGTLNTGITSAGVFGIGVDAPGSHTITIGGSDVADFFGSSPVTTNGVEAVHGFGPGVMTASLDAGGHLVFTADAAGYGYIGVNGTDPASFVGTPVRSDGADAFTVVKANPDIGRSEWGLFYRNIETHDATNSTNPVWTQISSSTSITDGKLGRTAVADSNGKLPGAVGWTPTYTNTDPTGFFFDKNGKQLDATSSVAIDNLTVGGKNFGTLTLDMGATEFADKNGLATANQLTQDGYSTGAFEGVSIDDNSGIVSYNYSNGQTVQKWKIPIVSFNGSGYLKAEDGGAYTETIQSGSPIEIDGALSSSALEASNVDISDEFTKLIVTQQAFSANSKVISTASDMMDDILQIIR